MGSFSQREKLHGEANKFRVMRALWPWQTLCFALFNWSKHMNPLDFSRRAVILVVDDTADNLSLMSGLLKDKYKVKLAINGEKALAIARGAEQPDKKAWS
jgi:hypothetical protein